MGCNLDKALREKYGRRSIVARKGDQVKVMRGQFKGKLGKVGEVDVKNTRLQIEGIQRAKKMGGEKLITWFHPSSVRIIVLNLDDSRRMKRSDIQSTESKESAGATEKVVTDKTKKTTVKKAVKEKKK